MIQRFGEYRLQRLFATPTNPIDGVTDYVTGTATDSWVVDSQYYNRTVAVRSGNYYLGQFVVGAAGQLTLDVEVKRISVGYPFDFEIKTLPVEISLNTGSMIGLPKRISRAFIGLYESYSMTAQGYRLTIRETTDDLSLEPTPKTGTQEFFFMGYDRDAQLTISQIELQPVTVLGINMEVSF